MDDLQNLMVHLDMFLEVTNIVNSKNNKKYINEKIVEAKKGDVIIFDGNVWHSNSAKIENQDRWVVVFRFSPWFYRPSFQNEFNTPINLYNKWQIKKNFVGF